MPARKFTVTHADGTVSRRSSARANYTFAVVCGPKDPAKAAAYHRAEAEALRAVRDRLVAALAAGQVKIRDRGFRTGGASYHSHEAFLVGAETRTGFVDPVRAAADGTSEVYAQNLDGSLIVDAAGEPIRYEAPVREAVLQDVERRVCRATEGILAQEAEAARLEALEAPEGGWGVVRWTSRQDLGLKAAQGEFAYLTARGYRVEVVPVDAA